MLDLDLLQHALDVEGADQSAVSREMILAGFPHAIAGLEGREKHKFQKGMLRIVESSLDSALAAVVKQQRSCKEQVATAEESFEQAQAAENNAAGVSAARREKQEAMAAAEQSAKAEVASAAVYFEELEKAKEAVLEKRAEVKGQKKAAEDVVLALRKVATDSVEDSHEAGMIMKYLSDVGAEKAVLVSAPHALSTRPSKRRKFDQRVVEEASDIVAHALSRCEARLAEDAEEEADTSVEALGAWAILDVARDKELDARQALREAGRALRVAEEAVADAKGQVDSCRSAMSQSLVQQTLLEEKAKEVEAALKYIQRLAASCAEAKAPSTTNDEEECDAMPQAVEPLPRPEVDESSA